MEDKYSDPKFDFAKFVCGKHDIDPLPVLAILDLYSRCSIGEEEVLMVLQWLPEKPRITIWNAYKNVNIKC